MPSAAARLRLVAFAGCLVASVAGAQAPVSGFYGGVTLRENGAEQGLAIGAAGNPDRFVPSLAAPVSQALVFGGYRWRNDLALEASLPKMIDEITERVLIALGH